MNIHEFSKQRCTRVMNTLHTLDPGTRGRATFSSIWAWPKEGTRCMHESPFLQGQTRHTHLLVVERERLTRVLLQHLLHAFRSTEGDESKATAGGGGWRGGRQCRISLPLRAAARASLHSPSSDAVVPLDVALHDLSVRLG